MKIDKNTNDTIEFHQDRPYPKQVAKKLDENVIFQFPDGVPAFEDSKHFVIVLNDNIAPFVYLKSLDVEGLGFICIDPFLVKSDYVVNLPAKDMSILELKDPGNGMVLCTVTVDQDPEKITANMLAPMVINMETSIGRQVVLDEARYDVKFRIWDALESIREAEQANS